VGESHLYQPFEEKKRKNPRERLVRARGKLLTLRRRRKEAAPQTFFVPHVLNRGRGGGKGERGGATKQSLGMFQFS